MIVSPTEPEPLRALAKKVSLTPERHGVDVFWLSKQGLAGIQRKEFPGDFLSSVNDGRLSKEVSQMRRLDVAVLVLEGKARWTNEGELITDSGFGRWSKAQHRTFLYSVRAEGIWVEWSEDVADTIAVVRAVRRWANKAIHDSVRKRADPKPTDGWGRVGNREYARYLLQGFDGIGPRTADAILDHFGGLPFRWTCTAKDMEKVPGIGKKTAGKIMKGLEGYREGRIEDEQEAGQEISEAAG